MSMTYSQYRRTAGRSYDRAAISYAEEYLGESSVVWPSAADVRRVVSGDYAPDVAGDVAVDLLSTLPDWSEDDADIWARDYALTLDLAAHALVIDESKFLAEVRRLGGTLEGASDWLAEARNIGLTADDTAESLAWTCVDDEASNLDHDDPRAATLRSNLEAARS